MTELTKVCKKCGEEKPLDKFGKSGKYYRAICKECKKESMKEYFENNKEYSREYNKKYYENNKESMNNANREYYENNKESMKEYNKKYYQNNREQIKEYIKEYVKTRRKTDYKFRIKMNISNLLRMTYKRYSTKGRQVSSSSIFTQEAMDHLIATKPTDDLKYHIDHIIPISAFNVDDVEHLKLAHLKENLRWLEASANIKKQDLIDWPLIESCPKLTEIAKIIGLKKNLDIAA